MAKWIYDGDCMITSCCHTAYDINKFKQNDNKISVPCKCPNCGEELIVCSSSSENTIEELRLSRCKKCSKSAEADNFQGGTELYCPLHGYLCDMIKQCSYIEDNRRYE